ncbi:MAG: hypothetical protein AABZ12_12075 [Planctomycetota bacterium]
MSRLAYGGQAVDRNLWSILTRRRGLTKPRTAAMTGPKEYPMDRQPMAVGRRTL